jgi:predicted ATPase/DNA-binding CsgD family transcriptional regulator
MSVVVTWSVEATHFVGRVRELDQLRGLAGRGRLLTLFGTGGSGKTRLALELARVLNQEGQGRAAVVELAALSEPGRLAATVGAALGMQSSAAVSEQAIAHHVGRDDLLVVLDNCEHLVDGVAVLVEVLLGRCPNLRVLATSREPLGVAGEVTWWTPPLSLPARGSAGLDELAASDAVALFVERAGRARPEFVLDQASAAQVARVCRQLDGLPLAIELAAARLRSLSIEHLAEALTDRFRLLTGGAHTGPRRQQTMLASLDWGHDLLSEPEQAVLRRLGVFAGGFTVDAAAQVVAVSPVPASDVLALVGSLVERSFVVPGQSGRHGLLETVRDYALAWLVAAGEAAEIRDRHLVWAQGLVGDQVDETLAPYGLDAWRPPWADEMDNLRAALDWAVETSQPAATSLPIAVSYLETARGSPPVAAAIAERALATAEPGLARLALLRNRAVALELAGKLQQSKAVNDQLTSEALALGDIGTDWLLAQRPQLRFDLPELRDHARLAMTAATGQTASNQAVQLAMIEAQLGNWREAEQLAVGLLGRHNRAYLALARAATVNGRLSQARNFLGQVDADRLPLSYAAVHAANVVRTELLTASAPAHLEEINRLLEQAARNGNEAPLTYSGWVTGTCQLVEGRTDDAVTSLLGWQDRLVAAGIAHPAGPNIIEALLAAGRYDQAQAELSRQQTLAPDGSILAARLSQLSGLLARHHRDLDEASRQLLDAAGRQHEAGWPMDLVDSLEGLAGVAVQQNRHQLGIILARAAQAIRAQTGYQLRWPYQDRRLRADLAHALDNLGQQRFERLWNDGVALDASGALAESQQLSPDQRSCSGGLTPTEMQVARLAAQGLTNRDIAGHLIMSAETVKSHLGHIYTKLGIPGRRQLRDIPLD